MRTWWAALAAVMLALAACGGGADLTKARVRLVNASSYDALDMSVDGERRFAGVAYGGSESYVDVDPDKTSSSISRPGSATILASFTPSLRKDSAFTVLAWGPQGSLKSMVLDDNASDADNNQARLRVINTATDAGSLDVYLTGSNDALADAVPVQAAVAQGTVASHVTVNAGTWRLRVTAAGDKTDLRLDVPALALADRSAFTLVLTPGRGGVLVNALLLRDRGGIARADSTQARVRVAAGVPAGGSVSASVGGTALMSAVGAPAVGVYALVSAASPAVVASVNGTAATGTAGTLAGGGDYTLLVYGTLAAPKYAWIEDDNHKPTSSGAKLRLVHGMADLAGSLSLTADFLPVADGVAQGAASGYAAVAASTTAALSVTTPGVAAPVYTATDKVFAAGGTYTLFLVGAQAAPVGVLRQDR